MVFCAALSILQGHQRYVQTNGPLTLTSQAISLSVSLAEVLEASVKLDKAVADHAPRILCAGKPRILLLQNSDIRGSKQFVPHAITWTGSRVLIHATVSTPNRGSAWNTRDGTGATAKHAETV